VIWHPELPHGGAPITKPGGSRRSLVAHYIPLGVPISSPKAFFERSEVGTRAAYSLLGESSVLMIDQIAPRFFHNRYEGNFDEF